MTRDRVVCSNCDFDGTVEKGADECPECHYIGGLAWKYPEDSDRWEIEI